MRLRILEIDLSWFADQLSCCQHE